MKILGTLFTVVVMLAFVGMTWFGAKSCDDSQRDWQRKRTAAWQARVAAAQQDIDTCRAKGGVAAVHYGGEFDFPELASCSLPCDGR